jgi:hypothetical protein
MSGKKSSAGKNDSAEENGDNGTVDEETQQSAAQIVEYVETAYELGRTTDGLLFASRGIRPLLGVRSS